MTSWLDVFNTCGLIIVGLIAAWNRRATKNLSIQVDGRLTELLELTKKSSHAEGVLEEKDRLPNGGEKK